MIKTIPGTLLPFKEGEARDTFKAITPIFTVTSGLTLAQMCRLTGLNASTIQNWIKRGWVASPKDKRYGEEQAVRIMLINSLRASLQMDQIQHLMTYINGSVTDRSDDIINDTELFNVFCKIIWISDTHNTFSKTTIKRIIDEELRDYSGPLENSKQRLSSALLVMTLAYLSAQLRAETDEEFKKIINT